MHLLLVIGALNSPFVASAQQVAPNAERPPLAYMESSQPLNRSRGDQPEDKKLTSLIRNTTNPLAIEVLTELDRRGSLDLASAIQLSAARPVSLQLIRDVQIAGVDIVPLLEALLAINSPADAAGARRVLKDGSFTREVLGRIFQTGGFLANDIFAADDVDTFKADLKARGFSDVTISKAVGQIKTQNQARIVFRLAVAGLLTEPLLDRIISQEIGVLKSSRRSAGPTEPARGFESRIEVSVPADAPLTPDANRTRFRLFSANTTFGNLYRSILHDASLAGLLSGPLRNQDAAAQNTSNLRDARGVDQRGRALLNAIGGSERLRNWFLSAAVSDMNVRNFRNRSSFAIEKAMGRVSEASLLDVLIIGAGPHGTIVANEIRNVAPNARIANVDTSPSPGANFNSAGFRLNSSSSPDEKGVIPEPKKGNKNALPGAPVQVPDIDPNRFPEAKSLATAITLNLASADSDVYLQRKVVGVEDGKQTGQAFPRRYRVTLSTGEQLYTEVIVNAIGLGETSIPTTDAATLKLAEEIRLGTPSSKAAELMKSEQLFDWIERNANQNPYKPFVNQRVAVVGTGDSGNTAIEWLLRVVNPKAYGLDRAQSGYPKEILWVGQEITNCKDFLNSVRVRYNDISLGYQNGLVRPVPPKFSKAEKLPDGTFRLTLSDGSSQNVDRVIFATGKASTLADVFKYQVEEDFSGRRFDAKNRLETSDVMQVLTANIGGKIVAIGRRLMASGRGTPVAFESNIFGVGPGGAGTDLIADNDVKLAGVSANKVSLFIWGSRTAAVGRYIGGLVQTMITNRSGPLPLFAPPIRSNERFVFGDSSSERSIQFPLADVAAGGDVALARLYVSARIATEFAHYAADSQVKEVSFRFLVTQNGVEGRLNPGVKFASWNLVSKEIQSDPEFRQAVSTLLGSAKESQKNGGYVIVLENKDGRLNPEGHVFTGREFEKREALRAKSATNGAAPITAPTTTAGGKCEAQF